MPRLTGEPGAGIRFSVSSEYSHLWCRLQTICVAAVVSVASAIGIRFERKLSKDDVDAGSGLVEMASEISSKEMSRGDSSSILEFAEAKPLRMLRTGSPNRQDSSPVINDNRGAAALQFLLVVYISPVEICLKMLTCYQLRGL